MSDKPKAPETPKELATIVTVKNKAGKEMKCTRNHYLQHQDRLELV